MAGNSIFEAQGETSKLVLLPDRVRIIRDNPATLGMAYYAQGDKVILINYISALQLRSTGRENWGFLQIEYLGRMQEPGLYMKTALVDENTIRFSREQEPAFIKFRDLLEERMALYHVPPQMP